MPTIPSIETFTGGQVLTHTSLNTLVSSIRDTVNTYGMLTDTSRTVTAVQTFSAIPIFSGGITVATGLGLTGSLTMATAASKIVPGVTSLSLRNNADNADNLILTDAGAATFRSTVGGITTLSCTTVTATNLGGTLSTAAQPNITSFGALTALSIGGNLTFTGADRTIIPGTSSFTVKAIGGSVDQIVITTNLITLGPGCVSSPGGNILVSKTGFATNTTEGFLVIGSMSGVPSGAPPSDGALMVDVTNHRLYVRSGSAWKYAALT